MSRDEQLLWRPQAVGRLNRHIAHTTAGCRGSTSAQLSSSARTSPAGGGTSREMTESSSGACGIAGEHHRLPRPAPCCREDSICPPPPRCRCTDDSPDVQGCPDCRRHCCLRLPTHHRVASASIYKGESNSNDETKPALPKLKLIQFHSRRSWRQPKRS